MEIAKDTLLDLKLLVEDNSSSTLKSFTDVLKPVFTDAESAVCMWHEEDNLCPASGANSLEKCCTQRQFKWGPPVNQKLFDNFNNDRLTNAMVKRQLEYALRHCEGSLEKLRKLFVYAA